MVVVVVAAAVDVEWAAAAAEWAEAAVAVEWAEAAGDVQAGRASVVADRASVVHRDRADRGPAERLEGLLA